VSNSILLLVTLPTSTTDSMRRLEDMEAVLVPTAHMVRTRTMEAMAEAAMHREVPITAATVPA